MAQLSTKIKLYVGSEVDFNSDVLLQNDSDGKGAYIKEWNLSIAKPTTAQLDALETEAQALEEKAEYDAKQYQRDNEPEQPDYIKQRRNSYPEIGDQLDMLWHSIDKNPSLKSEYFEFYEAIKAVKVKHPKNG
jgi:hypothetical protein